ncbi:MAG: GNAT family N-acetyltransferase [Bacteroidia bacterium]|nr:GNAT family N-acetyltransferase [Bacteroidia bacterium]
MNQSSIYPHFHVKVCKAHQFKSVELSVKELDLDDRQMSPEQFMVVEEEGKLMGFVRLKKYRDFAELCTLGVLEQFRFKGIATELVKTIKETANCPLYLVSTLPDFFSKLGFVECENYPTEIHQKLAYCKANLPVDEKYVVMRAR